MKLVTLYNYYITDWLIIIIISSSFVLIGLFPTTQRQFLIGDSTIDLPHKSEQISALMCAV